MSINGTARHHMTESECDDIFRRLGIGTFDENGKWHSSSDVAASDKPKQYKSSPYEVVQRASAYVDRMPAAISGQGGHSQTFKVACTLVIGFGLSIDEAYPIMQRYSARCQPPWSDREILHKLRDADSKPGPRGTKLNKGGDRFRHDDDYRPNEPFRRLDELKPSDFPIDVFPFAIQDYLLSVAQSIDCPVDYAACSALVVAATCLGNSRAIKLKNGWIESARIYLAIVADPSEGKTPSAKAVCRPIYTIQSEQEAEYRRQMAAFEESEASISAWRRQRNKPGTTYTLPPDSAEKPVYPHWYTTNSTVEKLGVMLRDCPRGLLMSCDELVAWVTGLNQYKSGKGNDRQFFLSAWSGNNIKVDRKNDECSVNVPNPFLNILGGIQPDMLNSMCDEKGRRDGFIERILFSYPQPVARKRWNDKSVDPMLADKWMSVCRWLSRLEMDRKDHGLAPHVVSFTPAGKSSWVTWCNMHLEETESIEQELRGVWRKLEAYAGRLALLMQMIRLADGEVSGEDVDEASVVCAVCLIEYFKTHAKKTLERMMGISSQTDLVSILGWIEKRGGTVKVRDLQRFGPIAMRKKSSREITLILGDLEDKGFGKLDGTTFTTIQGNTSK